MDKPKADRIRKAEHDALRRTLAGKGLKTKDIDNAVGIALSGRSRQQVAGDLIAWARALPKA